MTTRSLPRRLTTLAVVTLASTAALFAPAARADEDALFSDARTLQVEISAPWRQFVRKSGDQAWPAGLAFVDADGVRRQVSLTVERRGISRQRVCDFPPIRLRFEPSSVEGTMFADEGALKLVTHCDDGRRWTQYYVLEMLAYRIYNLVSDYSFRVRPLDVRYRDVDRDRDPEPRFAFLIEDVDEMARRYGMKEIEIGRISPARLNPDIAAQAALFQFMVGNLDWSALSGPGGECCHNVKLIGDSEDEDLVPVPYDFDATGLVGAHYALPPDRLPVRSVRTRLYRGFCVHNGFLPAARERFLAQREAIMAVIGREPRLLDRNRRDAENYLQAGFDILADDARFEEKVVEKCRAGG